MNVLLISQCEKRARTESCRILDQFAERRGERAWQTPITQVGLDTLRKMLKKTARKNTAVACHWIRGHDRSELLWIVGDARRFNERGAVPTNTTSRDVLRSQDENAWHSAEDIQLLATLASLFHDFGKASRAFQEKLKSRVPHADAYRHEWVSLRLFEAFVGPGESTDTGWLERLARCDALATSLCLERVRRDDMNGPDSPFRTGRLPPLAQVVGWLIVTHHRLPVLRHEPFNALGLNHLLAPVLAKWNDARADALAEEKRACWDFPQGLPFDSQTWRSRAQRCAQAMLARPGFAGDGARLLDDPYVMHISRLALMLADHHYSSRESEPRYGDPAFPLFANTDRTGQLKQRLDEHLAGVASHARRVVRALPRLEHDLPRIARCKSFQKRSEDARFRWQDWAYDLATSLREQSAEHGFFGINMASTGCGKTLANGRILYGLSNRQRGARFTVALGLRTLTLQTGAAYRTRLGLGDDDLAVLVGGGAVRELFELRNSEATLASSGSESAEGLLPEDSHVHFEGSLADGPLKQWLGSNPDATKLLQAPVLACTIDHLVPATECLRGGHQIGPMLRLMTSDLVLDEPDDFDLNDLPALSRLVHWSGMLGSRVLLSSATLPPALVEGLFEAYLAGREVFQRNRGVPGQSLAVPCAWFDEFHCEALPCAGAADFRTNHGTFVDERLERLRKSDTRRRARIVPITSLKTDRASVCNAFAARIPEWLSELHLNHHTLDARTGKRVSFGLVRMANIEPLISVAEALYAQGAPPEMRIHLCVYHARHPLLMRSAIEHVLDTTLQRSNELAVFDNAGVRKLLDTRAEPDHLFVVLASPVAEVGRDHDYDWAVVEPSSMRSIIQLAGRVRRHRAGPCAKDNLLLLNRNMKALQGKRPAYFRPGFEDESFKLKTSVLEELLAPDQLAPLDAGPRIRERAQLHAEANLVDLEHQRLRTLMLAAGTRTAAYTVPDWWKTRASLIGQLQHSQRFRMGPPTETFALVPQEDDESKLDFVRRDDDTWTVVNSLYSTVSLSCGPRIEPWGPADFLEALSELAEQLDIDLDRCARRYGTVQLRKETQGWGYHSALGFKAVS